MIERFLDAIDAAVEANDVARASTIVDALAKLPLQPSAAPASSGLPLVRFGRVGDLGAARRADEVFEQLWPKSHLAGELSLDLDLRGRREAVAASIDGIDDPAVLADRYRQLTSEATPTEAHEVALRWHRLAPNRTSLAAVAASTRRAPDLTPDARRALLSAFADADPGLVNDTVLATLANFCLDYGNIGLAQGACEVLFASSGGARMATAVLGRIAVDRKRAGDKGERDREREQADVDYRRDQAEADGFDRDVALARWLDRFRPS